MNQKQSPRVIAALRITKGSLSAFYISYDMAFGDGFVSNEPVDVEAINQQGYDIVCRDRNYRINAEEYNALIRSDWHYYVARLTTEDIPYQFSKIMGLLTCIGIIITIIIIINIIGFWNILEIIWLVAFWGFIILCIAVGIIMAIASFSKK